LSLKALTLRIDESLYIETKKMATKENSSVNSFIEKLIIEKLQEQENQELFNAFSIVGLDKDCSDVEFAFSAQKEVVLNEKP
jgi:hypothetical protein